MQKIHTTQDIGAIKDFSKGQKIVAALYLVTNHLSDIDPLKSTIRTHALVFVDQHADMARTAAIVTQLLGAAVLAGVLSDQNVSIITTEIAKHIASVAGSAVGGLFSETLSHNMSFTTYTRPTGDMSFKRSEMSLRSIKSESNTENKSKRQNEILSFINGRKSAAIKDIATLFPDVSEKTIQRELGTLVETGKITKRGSKRWSIYMAI